MLSHERATSSDDSIDLKAELAFKGKGTRTKLNPSIGIKFQWFDSGSNRIGIDRLKWYKSNRYNTFTYKNFAIYALDVYSVHLML